MSDQQARLSLETREPSNLLKPVAKELADKVETARAPMKTAEDALRERSPDRAVPPQEKAIDTLKNARQEIADLIAKAEAKKNDPLAALKDAQESLDRLLKDQVSTRDQTKNAGEANRSKSCSSFRHSKRIWPIAPTR